MCCCIFLLGREAVWAGRAALLHVCMYLSIERQHSMTLGLGARWRRGENSPRGSHLLLRCDRKWRLCAPSAALKTLYPSVIYCAGASRAEATPPHHHTHTLESSHLGCSALGGWLLYQKRGERKKKEREKKRKAGHGTRWLLVW